MRPIAKLGVMVVAAIMGLAVAPGVEAGSTDPLPEADCDENPGGCTFCAEDLVVCTGTVATCTSTLATCSTDLGSCNQSFATCTTDLGTCTGNVATCTADLGTCESALAASTKFPATGQGVGTPPIAGEDGNPAYGAALAYTADPAIGTALTVTDENTGLEWEVKTTAVGSGVNAADLHDVDNAYPWRGSCSIGGAECGTDVDSAGVAASATRGMVRRCRRTV